MIIMIYLFIFVIAIYDFICSYEWYDTCIYDFFIYIFQEKAFELAITMNHDHFTASNGWLNAWQRRYGVKLAVLCGESADVPEAAVQDWAQRLPEICKDYAPKNIFNADETGLYFRALPTRSMVVKGDPRKGTKSSKERITALLAASATGEKLKPYVIGKSQNPRTLRGMDKSLLTVTYKANKRAWMTSKLFSEWCDKLNSKMRASKRKRQLLGTSTSDTLQSQTGVLTTKHHITPPAMWRRHHRHSEGSLPSPSAQTFDLRDGRGQHSYRSVQESQH